MRTLTSADEQLDLRRWIDFNHDVRLTTPCRVEAAVIDELIVAVKGDPTTGRNPVGEWEVDFTCPAPQSPIPRSHRL